jgi:hypothetical protein
LTHVESLRVQKKSGRDIVSFGSTVDYIVTDWCFIESNNRMLKRHHLRFLQLVMLIFIILNFRVVITRVFLVAGFKLKDLGPRPLKIGLKGAKEGLVHTVANI